MGNFEGVFFVFYAIIFIFVVLVSYFIAKKDIELKLGKECNVKNLVLRYKKKTKIVVFLIFIFLSVSLFSSIGNLVVGKLTYFAEYIDMLRYPIVLCFIYYIVRFRTFLHFCERFLEKLK